MTAADDRTGGVDVRARVEQRVEHGYVEVLRLGRLLAELLPAEAEVLGLLALMECRDARGVPAPSRRVHTAMRQLFAGPLAGTRATYDIQGIRYLGTEIAVVISRGVVLLANQTDPAEAEPWMDTWVLSRDGDSWRVVSLRGPSRWTNRAATTGPVRRQ
jgi:hypothetical protein